MRKITALLTFATLLFISCRDDQPDQSTTASVDSLGPKVPDGYTVEIVAGPELLDFPMFATLDETGRLFVFESTGNVYDKTQDAIDNPQFRIKLLQDTTGDGIYDKMTLYADKVGFPQGGVFYQGSLYASSAPDLLKLTDTDNDGVADKREVILSGWKLNVNANSLVGPVMAPDGWFYMNNAIEGFDVTSKEGKRMKGETARMWRVKPDGSSLEWVSAGGMNNPVELAFTDAGEPIGTETYFTDPKGGERDALVYWIEGGVYPKPNENITRDKLILTGDLMPVVSKYSRVAPSGICSYRNSVFGNDFKHNLFSAQFNTHQVLRHKVIRTGASFRTEDEIFFWNNNEDFHPTDVLEDADGSLLVVETGGWFIKGCPLSAVSKPELKGSIYRVRKKDAEKIDDPYGNTIKWKSLTADKLSKYLEDSRPFVADRAIQSLAELKDGAVNALTKLIQQSNSADARTKAVFALYRSGAAGGLPAIRHALTDKDPQVGVAAARCLGLAKDPLSVGPLIKLLQNNNSPATKRQAATALGQIGNTSAVNALLNSAAGDSDRFISHAIIYSLVSLNEPAATRMGLANSSTQVKETALIALDQMPGSPLTFPELTGFLTGSDQQLQRRALWVASHHPGWSREMTGFLRERFKDSLNLEEEQLATNLLVAFGGSADMQTFMADQLNTTNKSRKLMILDAMQKTQSKQFPAFWANRLPGQLAPGIDPEVKTKVLELIQLRGIKGLDISLQNIAADARNPATLRMQAISALKKPGKQLSNTHFAFLYEQLQTGKEVSLRQQAATVLEGASLNEQQLKKIAMEYLPAADAYLMQRLVSLFAGNHSAEIGRAVASTLQQSPVLDGFSEETITKLFDKYPPEIKPQIDSLLVKLKTVRAARLQRLQEYEAALDGGVIDRGRVLFYGKATCSTCHTIGSEGGSMGPDLTSIQRDRSVHDLLEAIVYPGASFVREFETFKIKTNSGDHVGIIKTKSPEAIILNTSPQSSVRINRNEISSMEVQDVSMMPQGLDKILTKEEMADLMVFLLGQDQDPETDSKILRHTSTNKK